jgi:hypothetical protein
MEAGEAEEEEGARLELEEGWCAGCVEAGEVEAGEVEAGEVMAGEVEAGEVEAGEVEAGEVEAGGGFARTVRRCLGFLLHVCFSTHQDHAAFPRSDLGWFSSQGSRYTE